MAYYGCFPFWNIIKLIKNHKHHQLVSFGWSFGGYISAEDRFVFAPHNIFNRLKDVEASYPWKGPSSKGSSSSWPFPLPGRCMPSLGTSPKAHHAPCAGNTVSQFQHKINLQLLNYTHAINCYSLLRCIVESSVTYYHIYNRLVVSTPLKHISPLGWLFPIYGKKCSKPPTRYSIKGTDAFKPYKSQRARSVKDRRRMAAQISEGMQ